MKVKTPLAIGLAIGGVAVLIAVVLIVILRGTDDPKLDATPALAVGDESVAAYLSGPGALVVKFRELIIPVLALDRGVPAGERRKVCRSVATSLDDAVDPAELFEAVAGIPDPVLVEFALDERSALSKALLACEHHDVAATDAALKQTRASDELFVERLGEGSG